MSGITDTDLPRGVRRAQPAVRTLLIWGYAETEGVAADLPTLTKPFRKADLAEASSAPEPADGRASP